MGQHEPTEAGSAGDLGPMQVPGRLRHQPKPGGQSVTWSVSLWVPSSVKKSPQDSGIPGWLCHEQERGPGGWFVGPWRAAEAVCPGHRNCSCPVSL